MSVEIPQGSTVLFIGDSITDAGRRDDPLALGSGYVREIANRFTAAHPMREVTFLNRGIGGDRAVDLVARWNEDAIELKPDVISVMVGVNDMWRRFDNDDPTTSALFEAHYRTLLEQSTQRLQARLLLIEPFLLPVRAEMWQWREDLDAKIQVTRRLAAEFGATLLSADGLFAQAASGSRPEIWAADGVHPTPAGHSLLADAWLRLVTPAAA